jgi:predicted dehydrogenase
MAIRIGLIGCGEYCSRTHASVLYKMEDTQIVAISDCVFSGELAKRQRQFDIPYGFTNYIEMLENVVLDAVVISTPHSMHFSQARYSLKKGLHVLVDKPLACRYIDGLMLVNLANSKGLHLIVAAQRRFDPTFVKIRELVQNNSLGDLRFVRFNYGRSKVPNFTKNWRNDPKLSGGGVLIDAGYHIVDSMLWITGREPKEIYGSFSRNKTNVETATSLTLDLGENAIANISVHLEMPHHGIQEELEIIGSKGVLKYQYQSLPKDLPSSTRLSIITNGYLKIFEGAKNQICDRGAALDFVNAITDRAPIVSSGKNSLETIRVIEQIYRKVKHYQD